MQNTSLTFYKLVSYYYTGLYSTNTFRCLSDHVAAHKLRDTIKEVAEANTYIPPPSPILGMPWHMYHSNNILQHILCLTSSSTSTSTSTFSFLSINFHVCRLLHIEASCNLAIALQDNCKTEESQLLYVYASRHVRITFYGVVPNRAIIFRHNT